MMWTEDMVAVLKREWELGSPCSQIARIIKIETKQEVSRCAVIGKANRLGLSRGHKQFIGRPNRVKLAS